MKRNFFLTACLLLFNYTAFCQCMVKVTPLDARVGASELIIEGKVVNQYCFRGEKVNLIYTANVIEVYKVFKGQFSQNQIEIITQGGVLNDEATVVNPSLQLQKNQSGLFMLTAYQGDLIDNSRGQLWRPLDAHLGLVAYDQNNQSAKDFTYSFPSLAKLYHFVERQTGQNFREVKELPKHIVHDLRGGPAPSIGNISPTTSQAGTGQVLTITGMDFGTLAGNVFIANANDGGMTYYAVPSDTWSNTMITATIPSGVGTGQIFVRDGNGMDSPLSVQTLTIEYNVTNASSTEAKLIDDLHDGDGGYMFMYSTSTANNGVDITSIPDALAALEAAAGSWANDTGFPSFLGLDCGTTTIQAPGNDGVNIISFDSDATNLGGNVLGTCYSQYSQCGASDFEVVGLDLVMRRDGQNGIVWNFAGAPGAGESDFESVALHELGHGHQLGHVISPGAVMHYSITTGTSNTSPGANDIAGGSHIMTSNCLGYSPPIVNCSPAGDFPFTRQCATYNAGNTVCLAAPIDWLTFDGRAERKGALLTWTTASEYKNDYFTLQHSDDGVRFSTIATITGAGTASFENEYEFLDKDALPGVNYYRLSQADFDGTVQWINKVVAVEMTGATKAMILPNPVNLPQFSVAYYAEQSGDLEVQLFDLNGREIFARQFAIEKQNNTLELDVPGLTSGLYLLRIQQGNKIQHLRLVKT